MKNFLIIAAALCVGLMSNLAFAGYDVSHDDIEAKTPIAGTDILSTDYLQVFRFGSNTSEFIPANTAFGLGTEGSDLTGRATVWICGDATTVNNNTVYYGPSATVVAGAGRVCDITQAGSTTEATADAPAFDAMAFQVLSWYCLQPDANADLTYTLRSAVAGMTPAQTISIADNGLSGQNKVGTTTAIASGATLAIGVSSTSNVGTAQWACAVNVAF